MTFLQDRIKTWMRFVDGFLGTKLQMPIDEIFAEVRREESRK